MERHPALASLPITLAGRFRFAGDPDWDSARQAWNLAFDQQPAAVAHPRSADEVSAVVAYAAANGLRVAPQGTGHLPGTLGSLAGSILLRTDRMRGVTVDPAARSARVEAGVLSGELARAAGEHGLAALVGTAADVGFVGYTLGGGASWLGRKHGLSSSRVTAVEIVTADGRLVRADREHDPDLFWAVRGGGGSFGVVTALEVDLVPLAEVYAGVLWWPIERATEVLQAWRELTARADLPDELTTCGRLLQYPPIPQIPEAVRGRSFVVVEVVFQGAAAAADALLAPLRALGPAMDTVATMPAAELSRVHMDPEQPVPGAGDGMTLSALPPEAVDALVAVAGGDAGSPLISVELRHLGGELGRAHPEAGALESIPAAYCVFAVGIAPTPELAAAARAHVGVVQEALAPWVAPRMFLNFCERRREPGAFWSVDAYDRLCRIKAQVDPGDVFQANHPVVA